jgi:polyisoprenoid-binding protein YceI
MSTATTSRIEAGTWALDSVHSVAGFRVKHFGLTWLRGKFTEFDLQLVASEDGSYQLTGGAPIESISFPNEQLHGHLMSPDFFDAQLHPRIEFASTEVTLAEDGTATIIGNLTIKGTSLPVTLRGTWSGPVEGLGGETRLGLEITGEIDRNAYGVSWEATLPTGQEVLSKAVKLEGEFELALQA